MHDIKDKNITLTPLNLIENFGVFDLDPCPWILLLIILVWPGGDKNL